MLEVSEEITQKIFSYVKSDLQPSSWSVCWRVVLSILLGGVLSLLFCGQFGVGFSNMAQHCNHTIHHHMGEFKCSMICGAIFSIAPIMVLRLLCSHLLFKKIIYGYSPISAVFLVVAGLIMFLKGSFMYEILSLTIWTVSAYATYQLFGYLMNLIIFSYSKDLEA